MLMKFSSGFKCFIDFVKYETNLKRTSEQAHLPLSWQDVAALHPFHKASSLNSGEKNLLYFETKRKSTQIVKPTGMFFMKSFY